MPQSLSGALIPCDSLTGRRQCARSLVMVRALREYLQHTGYKVGFKPAGGISNAKTALNFMAMMKDELGAPSLPQLGCARPTILLLRESSL